MQVGAPCFVGPVEPKDKIAIGPLGHFAPKSPGSPRGLTGIPIARLVPTATLIRFFDYFFLFVDVSFFVLVLLFGFLCLFPLGFFVFPVVVGLRLTLGREAWSLFLLILMGRRRPHGR